MNVETKNEVLSIIKGLNDKEMRKEVSDIQKINPVESLRLTIFEFYKNRLSTIEKDEQLKIAVENQLLQKLANNELTVPQLISLARGLRSDTIMAVDSLLSILKPVPNASNPLMDKNKEDSESKLLEAFNNLSSDENTAIETLTQIVRENRERKLREAAEKKESIVPFVEE